MANGSCVTLLILMELMIKLYKTKYMMKKILKKIKSNLQVITGKLFSKRNWIKEMSYEDYINLQLTKTKDEGRIKKWLNEEWEIKLVGFQKMFKGREIYFKDAKKALCLGARTGQEVAALRNLGIDSIGVDLVEFPPYTIEGDIHNLPFEKEIFDFAFTNIYDHILYPEKFAQECSRVLRANGNLLLHISLGFDPDEYSVSYTYSSTPIIDIFAKYGMKIVKEGVISNDYDSMNYELVFNKTE